MLIIWYSLAGELEGATFDRFCLGIFSQMLFPTDFTEPTGDVLSKITDIKGWAKCMCFM
jgi:hypothetical protein